MNTTEPTAASNFLTLDAKAIRGLASKFPRLATVLAHGGAVRTGKAILRGPTTPQDAEPVDIETVNASGEPARDLIAERLLADDDVAPIDAANDDDRAALAAILGT